MASDEDLRAVEQILNYEFQSKEHLSHALTAAGADEENHEGNRPLYLLGVDNIRICLSLDGLKRNVMPRETAFLKQELSSKSHLAVIAERTAIDKCIKYCERSGRGRPVVTGTALAAIIAAVFLDCESHAKTWEIMNHMGFLNRQGHGVNPDMLQTAADPQGRDDVEGPGETWGAIPVTTAVAQHFQEPRGRAESLKEGTKHGHQITSFLTSEVQKCIHSGLPIPQEWYFNPTVQAELLKLGNDRPVAVKLLLCIASSQSVVILQQALRSWRTQADIGAWQVPPFLSKTTKFKVIEEINQNIVCLCLVRRYHILDLFEQCGGSSTPSFSGFIEVPGNSNAPRMNGNPVNRAETVVTARIMEEIFPELQPNTHEYEEKLESLKFIRQLGRRFHILTKEFGRGVLALIPYEGLPGQPDIALTDKMIHRLSERTLSKVTSILKHSQGDVLREFSTTSEKFIDALLLHAAYDCEPFALEETETNRILQCPRSSPELLSLLC